MKILSIPLGAILAILFTACGKTEPLWQNTDAGVVINGVKWATRNVDAFGAFAEKPEMTGMFYQWNKSKAWSAAAGNVHFDPFGESGTVWDKKNDPSPNGWRMPTVEEIGKLLDESKVERRFTTQSNVKGVLFTDRQSGNQLFLSAAGCRAASIGTDSEVYDAGLCGYYWSNVAKTGGTGGDAESLYFNGSTITVQSRNRADAYCVRSVAEH